MLLKAIVDNLFLLFLSEVKMFRAELELSHFKWSHGRVGLRVIFASSSAESKLCCTPKK